MTSHSPVMDQLKFKSNMVCRENLYTNVAFTPDMELALLVISKLFTVLVTLSSTICQVNGVSQKPLTEFWIVDFIC